MRIRDTKTGEEFEGPDGTPVPEGYETVKPRPNLSTPLNPADVVGGPVGRFAGPIIGAGYGALKGGALGMAGGPWGAAAGGIAGAFVGGMAGAAVPEAVDLVRGQPNPDAIPNVLEAGRGSVVGQMIGAPIGQAISGIPSAVRTAKDKLFDLSRHYGVDLTAAELSGASIFKGMEGLGKRLFGGADVFGAFGAKQAGQLTRAGEGLVERVTGTAPLDAATRSNRFLTALETRTAAAKRYGGVLFDRYIKAAGEQSPVDVSGVVDGARSLLAQMPNVKSLQNPRLRQILSDIVDLQKIRQPSHDYRVSVSPRSGTMTAETGAYGEELTTAPLGPTARVREVPSSTAPVDMITGQEIKRDVSLGELRKIRTALGEFAYPGKTAVTQEVPVAAARKLYGMFTESIKRHAEGIGPEAKALLDEMSQFERSTIHGTLDASWYAQVLKGDSLGKFAGQLFNPRDPGMLLDARAVVSPQGWKMIQQQYVDDVLAKGGSGKMFEGRDPTFDGRAVADRLLRPGEDNVLKVLFPPEHVAAIKDFAKVASAAFPTSMQRNREFTQGITGLGVIGGTSIMTDPATGLMVGASTAAMARGLAKIMTNPTAARILSNAMKTGSDLRSAFGAATKELIRAGEISAEAPSQVMQTIGGAGMEGLDALVSP